MNNKLMLPNDLYKSKAEKDAAARIITAGNVYFPEAKKRGITIYGSIAQYLEDNRENIDELSRKISYYMTNKKDLELLKKYEAESSLFEKFIKNGKYAANMRI